MVIVLGAASVAVLFGWLLIGPLASAGGEVMEEHLEKSRDIKMKKSQAKIDKLRQEELMYKNKLNEVRGK